MDSGGENDEWEGGDEVWIIETGKSGDAEVIISSLGFEPPRVRYFVAGKKKRRTGKLKEKQSCNCAQAIRGFFPLPFKVVAGPCRHKRAATWSGRMAPGDV